MAMVITAMAKKVKMQMKMVMMMYIGNRCDRGTNPMF